MWLPTDKPWLQDTEEVREILKKIEYLIRDRIVKFSDVKTLFDTGEFDYFFIDPAVDQSMIPWKTDTFEVAKKHLTDVYERIEKVSDQDWNYEGVKAVLWDLAEREGKGNILWPMRVALSGREKSPDPFELASILGRQKTLERIAAIK